MSLSIQSSADNHRQQPRITLPAMYTLLRLKAIGSKHYNRTGHIYDISMSGMRFELDFPIDPGSKVEVRVMLPGSSQLTFSAIGTIIRIHEDDQPQFGPSRMGLTFDEFGSIAERHKLQTYIEHRGFIPTDDNISRAA
ncbi:PilZ domain-containing protein [Poriferisphaera sp. WC338]|uniref:PilZ domain-containing protein n=1 Tax=Poriferisphaera sp. WC338 TaxID=3425129 RepID=UPI003D81AC33